MTRILLTGPLLILFYVLKWLYFAFADSILFSYYKRCFPLHPSFDGFNFFIIPKLSRNSLLITLKVRRKSGSAVIKPVGEVFPPRKSGTRSSSLCEHQQISDRHICRPRIPHALCPCGFSHKLLQCDVRGTNSYICCHVHAACRLHRQWLLGLNTLHR